MGMCFAGWLGTGFYGNTDRIKLRLDKGIWLVLYYISFEGCNNGNIEVLVTGFRNGINVDILWFFVVGLVKGFDGDSYGITLIIDEVIELDFSDRYFEVCGDGKLEGIVKWLRDGINVGVGIFVADGLGTGLDGDKQGIKNGIDEGIELGVSDIYIEGCNNGNIEGIVIGVIDGINVGVDLCVLGWLITGFYGYSDVITLGIYKLI